MLLIVVVVVLTRSSVTPPTIPPATNLAASPSAVQSLALVEATEAVAVPTTEIAAGVTAEATAVPGLRLTYDDNTFNLINDGAATFDLSALQFAHGSNLFDGSAVPRGTLPAGTCFRIQLQRTQSRLPDGCGKLYGATYLPTTQRFFWRSEPDGSPTFEVRLNGDVISTCPTIPRGGNSACTFSLSPAE